MSNSCSARDLVNSNLAKTQTNSNTRPNSQPTEDKTPIGLFDYPPEDPRSREHATGRRKSRSTERNIQYRARRESEEQTRRKSNDTRARNKAARHTQSQDPAAPSDHTTNYEQDQPTQDANNSQYTYEYETLDHEGLVNYAQEALGLDLQDFSTQQIIDALKLVEEEQTVQVGLTGRPPSIVLLPPTPFQVGGGWSQDVVAGASSESSKRQSNTVDPEDTATESESDDTATEPDSDDAPVAPSSPLLGESFPQAEPPVPPESQPALDPGRLAEEEEPVLPNLLYPLSGSTHARLRAEALKRYFVRNDRTARAATARARARVFHVDDTGQSHLNANKVPEAGFESTSVSQRATQGSSNPYTYSGSRSHLPTDPTNNTTSYLAQPNSLGITPDQLIRRERARAVAAKAHAEMATLAPRRRSGLFTAASQPPASRSQPRPPLGGRGNTVGRHTGGPRRMDPVSTARADMVAFNRAVARGEATSLVESVRRQSERTARCAPPQSRSRDELLDDNEEMLAQAEAYANSKWPPRRRRIRKSKPLARDVSGIERQVLIMAKIHLFAYALVEGIYQTRATFLMWAAAVHHATWQMELPDKIYKQPSHDIFEIMVNNIATLRGKAKERLREFAARVAGFKQRMRDQSAIQHNLDRFSEIYPNSYHCKSSNPREGDYENPEVGHCIALVVFHGPNSVGVLYPDYFLDMPLTVVAFCLAIWQFCIEEWANGWRQNGDLGMAAMREKYESQHQGLKDLRKVAPKRMHRLQNHWRDYVAEYSGAVFVPEAADDAPARASRMRPDTPEPEGDAIAEMEATLFETARQESIREHMEQLAAQELADAMEFDEDEGSRPSTPRSRSRSPTPLPLEYNEHGVQTAHSKGKGHAG